MYTVITIGNFDGLHVGHMRIINAMKSLPGEHIVISFKKHTSHTLKTTPEPQIYTKEHLVKLLNEVGIHKLIFLNFTQTLANQNFRKFLCKLHKSLKFNNLVLGEDACLGKNREGCVAKLKEFGHEIGFEVIAVPRTEISSGTIRKLIKAGDLKQASALLGRPYSIYSKLTKRKDYYTITLKTLILPPKGEYSCLVENIPGTLLIDDRKSIQIKLKKQLKSIACKHEVIINE